MVFDSGIGGLNVFYRLVRRFPYVDFYYCSDGKNCPYGGKDKGELAALSVASLKAAGAQNFDGLVIACNTLSTNVLSDIRANFSIPVFGVLPPPDLKGKTALFCTPATSASQYVKTNCKGYTVCPLKALAADVERNAPDFEKVVVTGLPGGRFDNVVLGCTHYIYMKRVFAGAYPGANFYDGTERTLNDFFAVFGDDAKNVTTCDKCITICSKNFIGDDKLRNYGVFSKRFSKIVQMY